MRALTLSAVVVVCTAASRYGIVQALRQTLAAAVRWDYMSRNPAKLAGRNPEPPPRTIRAYTLAELDALAAELEPRYAPLVRFAAATGAPAGRVGGARAPRH